MAKTKRALLLFVILSMRHQSVHCLGGPGTPGFIATFFLVTDSADKHLEERLAGISLIVERFEIILLRSCVPNKLTILNQCEVEAKADFSFTIII